MEIFTLRALSFTYPHQSRPALDALDLSLEAGEFLLLAGPSGCGKSTLLRQLKPALTPYGQRSGRILFRGQPLEKLDRRTESTAIGFVQQHPDRQLVTDKVWHELAFGLESLGYDTPTIRRRVAEMASFFGLQTWFYKPVSQLSGGQKQLLNLAAVMAMQPQVLILDEPTSQLDPIAAADFLHTVGKLNRELGTTVILTEHRLEEAFSFAHRVAVLEEGRLLTCGSPQQIGAELKRQGHRMFQALPAAMRVWAGVESSAPCPVTVREGGQWLSAYAQRHPLLPLPPEPAHIYSGELALSCHELWFRYEKELPDVVRGLSLEVKRGEFLALLGGNGTGKSTSLRLLAGLIPPYRGEVSTCCRIGLLPQDPQTLFVKQTLRQDLLEILREQKIDPSEEQARLTRAVSLCRLGALLDRHPYDLSGGEQQRAALAKVLLAGPDLLLLDEPTKGLDAEFKAALAQILAELLEQGVTVVAVSHDVEFCARYAHRCALFFDGGIVCTAPPREFFAGNNFYTTAANRMSRELEPEAVTVEDVIHICGGQVEQDAALPAPQPLPEAAGQSPERQPAPLPRWRKLLAAVAAAGAVAVMAAALLQTDLTHLVGGEGLTAGASRQMLLYALCILFLVILAAAIGRRRPPLAEPQKTRRRKLSKRTLVACGTVLLLIPLTLYVGCFYLQSHSYYLLMLLVLLEAMAPFFLIFEGRKPKARELVLLAVLVALGVAGRALFFMLPECKPVLALTIITGVALGGESGFLVGALMMLVSNIMFGQGPWTPWQMFALGLIGFLAGLLYSRGLLHRSRGSLAVFGAFCAIVIYGGIMNPMAALVWSQELSWEQVLAYYITGFPVDCVRAASTALFLWFAAEPFLEKLERIKIKYGLVG